MAKVDGSVKDAVIANKDGSLLYSYSTSGGKIVYAYHGGTDEQLYEYDIDSGTSIVLSGMSAINPQIKGNEVVWERKDKVQGISSVQSYTIGAGDGVTTNLVAGPIGVADLALVGEKDIAFTVSGGTNPGYSIYLMSRNISNIKFK